MNRKFTDYIARKITSDTYIISENLPGFMNGSCDCYLLLGDRYAVVIDSGLADRNLKDFVLTLTELPILGVINTHGDSDHVLGNGYFEKAFMHPLAVADVKKHLISNPEYPSDYDIELLKDGQVIDLGNRKLEILFDGAHSLSSVAILDSSRRLLFSGDEIDPGQVLLNVSGKDSPGQTIENHQRNMKMLRDRYSGFDMICSGHNGSPFDKSYIDDFITLDQMIMDGVPGRQDIFSSALPFPLPDGALRLYYHCAHICYHPNTIFEKK